MTRCGQLYFIAIPVMKFSTNSDLDCFWTFPAFWTDAESTLLLCFIYNHFQINVNLQIDLKTIETIYLNTQGQCLTTPNSFTTILIYHYSDFFDDFKKMISFF